MQGFGIAAVKGCGPPRNVNHRFHCPCPCSAHMRRWHKNGQRYPVEYAGQQIDRIDKAFREMIKESGLDGEIVPHTFRHTAITWGMQRGMDPWDASGYFGLSLQTLLDTYGHHHPNHLREAANKMARPKAVVSDRVRQG